MNVKYVGVFTTAEALITFTHTHTHKETPLGLEGESLSPLLVLFIFDCDVVAVAVDPTRLPYLCKQFAQEREREKEEDDREEQAGAARQVQQSIDFAWQPFRLCHIFFFFWTLFLINLVLIDS